MARNWYGKRKVTRQDKYIKKIEFTKSDEYWEIFKMLLWIALGYLYLHFVVMGWHL
tara:strand:- start:2636 stop:2803 length:168 start_codon:yes stop_codon:yes gene_type:complete